MRGALLEHVLDYVAQAKALIAVSRNLLLELLGLRVLDVLAKDFKLFLAADHLILELANLLLEGHNKESLLLVFLSSLSQRHQAAALTLASTAVRAALDLALLNELIVREEVLDGLLFAVQLIFKNLDLSLELDGIITQLIVHDLHLDRLVVQLLFLFSQHPILTLTCTI